MKLNARIEKWPNRISEQSRAEQNVNTQKWHDTWKSFYFRNTLRTRSQPNIFPYLMQMLVYRIDIHMHVRRT